MKISLNTAQAFSNVDLNKIGNEKLVEKIGAQLGAVEETIEWGKRYDGVVVAKVMECVKHPNADKLHVCKIDDGKVAKGVDRDSKGYVQVVCGAPNVKEGLTVAWLPPGSTVPSTLDKDPFVLEARELRGVVSNGMLASPHELGISEDHNGILEITSEEVGKDLTKPGTPFKKLYGLDDLIIDVENKMFTHRPDCFGLLGVARELAGIQHLGFKSPDWYLREPDFSEGTELPLDIKVEDKKLVPRFMAVAVKGVRIGPSPLWMQAGLTRAGIRPINNIVDVTNFIMVLTGQPLHAYDYDKVKTRSGDKPTLIARKATGKEKLALLNGKTVEFEEPAILIATDKEPVGVGGVMGGKDTEVDEGTKNIILEVATFDMYSIRRTSMKYGLFTDAVTRFNKGQSPLQNDRVMNYALKNIFETAGGEIASKVHDVHGELEEPKNITITAQFINERLGLHLSLKDIAKLLENVEFKITTVPADKNRLHVRAPFWRTDIEIPEDVVEEVGRLYGFDHLPLELPERDITPAPKDQLLVLKDVIRESLAKAGANELLTYSFIHGDLMEKTGQDKNHAFKLSNAISPDLQYYRTSLTPSLLDKVHMNIKAGYGKFALFELSKVHYKGEWDEDEPGVPNEDNHLALVIAYDEKNQPGSGAPYYHARKYLDEVGKSFDLTPLEKFDITTDEWGRQLTAPYDPKRSAVIIKENQVWGVVGEFKATVRHALKLPTYVAGFELNLGIVTMPKPSYVPLPRFPKVEQDISLRVGAGVMYNEVYTAVYEEVEENRPEQTLWTLSPVDIYQREDDSENKQFTLRLTIASYERTLTADEVNRLLDKAAASLQDKLGAERI